MTAEPWVIYEADARIAYITLNRPDVRNALGGELLHDLHAALDVLGRDDDVRVAILRGSGPSFSSGFELTPNSKSVQSAGTDPWRDRERLLSWVELALRIWSFPRPVIAQVHGHCLGGGILLPLCADIVCIADDCVVGWPRLPMGAGFLDPAMSLLVGQRRAKEISYVVGSRITGAEAAAWGLANFAFSPAELEKRTLSFARQIAKTPRNVLEIRKAAITRANGAFREALLTGVEWDALAHVDPAVDTMRRLVREHGMKAVIEAFENADDPELELQRRRRTSVAGADDATPDPLAAD